MADARLVEPADLVPQRGEHVVGDLLGGELAERRPGLRSGHQHCRVGASDTGLHDLRNIDAGAVRDDHRVPDVLGLLDPAAEHREPRLPVHQPMPPLGHDLGVALVATEHVDAVLLTRRDGDVHHRPLSNRLLRGLDLGGIESEVGQRRPHLVDRRLARRRTERHQYRGGGRHPEQHTAEQVRRQSGAEVHRGECDEDHERE